MNEEKIKRINELYKKKKSGTITEEELAEQAILRAEYIEAIRKDLHSTLKNVSIQEKDETISPLTKKKKH